MNPCPNCKETSHQRKCGTTIAGSQRYSCKHYKTKYTPEPKERGYPDKLRHQAIRLYLGGMNYRRIARHLQAHNPTVTNWVKSFAAQLPDAPLPQDWKTVELDELFTFIETKKADLHRHSRGPGNRMHCRLARAVGENAK